MSDTPTAAQGQDGATLTPDPTPAAPAAPPTEPKPDGQDPSKLKSALERERELRRNAEKEARANAAYKAQVEALEAANQSELEKAVTAARREGAQEALAAANTRLVHAEARALAAEKGFRNPALAVRAIDLADVPVTSDGVVDADAITAALTKLAADEPYLIAEQGPRAPKPDPSQGSGRAEQPRAGQKGIAEAERRFGATTSTAAPAPAGR